MRLLTHIWTFIFVALSFCEGNAQITPFHVQWTEEDGLPTNELYWLHQSSDGYMWIGSDGGLVRYDGVSFKTYTHPEARNSSMNGIVEDSQGRLWCHNFAKQIFCFEGDSLRLSTAWEAYEHHNVNIAQMQLVEGDKLYVTGSGIASMYDTRKDTVYRPKIDSYKGVAGYYIDAETRMTSGIRGQIGIVMRDSTYYCAGAEDVMVKNIAYDGFKSNNIKNTEGTLFFLILHVAPNTFDSTGTRLYRVNVEEKKVVPIPMPAIIANYPNMRIVHSEMIGDSVIWLATSRGLFYWNYKTGAAAHYFNNIFVSDVYVDREQNIWITTLQKGLFMIPSLQVEMMEVIQPTGTINALEQDKKENLLIAHSTNVLSYVDIDKKQILSEISTTTADNIIEGIYYDSVGQYFWIESSKGITDKYFVENRTLERIKVIGVIKDLTPDAFGNVLIGGKSIMNAQQPNVAMPSFPKGWEHISTCYSRRARMDSIEACNGRRAFVVTTNTSERGGQVHMISLGDLDNSRCYSVGFQQKPEIRYWLGLVVGLHYFSQGNRHELKMPNGDIIIARAIEIDGDEIWVGSDKKGVLCFKDDILIEEINIEKGLRNNQVFKLIVEADYIWIGTQKGLSRYDRQTKEIINFDKSMGLPSFRVKDMASIHNKVYVTDGKDIYAMEQNYTLRPILKPLVNIEAFMVNGASWSEQIALDIPFQLQPDENNISIHYQGISYNSLGNFRYEYRLLGAEEEWNTASSANNIVRYPNLNDGSYTFQIKVVNAHGAASDIKEIKFEVAPYFYERWWFISIIIILIGGVIYIQFKRAIQKSERKAQEKLERAALELERSELERDLRISQLKALKAQMNPHFVFNVLNSIQGLYITNDKQRANLLLTKFSQLIRYTLDMSDSLETGIEEEIELLTLYLNVEKMRVQEQLDYTLTYDEAILDEDIALPSLLIQPYIENAIKHGLLHIKGQRKLDVKFVYREAEKMLSVTIDDNGIGRAASAKINAQQQQHKSFATSASALRLELLNTERNQKIGVEYIDKKDDTGQPIGTTVILNIPV